MLVTHYNLIAFLFTSIVLSLTFHSPLENSALLNKYFHIERPYKDDYCSQRLRMVDDDDAYINIDISNKCRDDLYNKRKKKKRTRKIIDVTMKFGGSSLAGAERICHVTDLIKSQIGMGYRPRAVICSAMGKTTNGLLSAGDFALDGRVNIDHIRALHTAVLDACDISHIYREVKKLLDECEDMLNGVRLIQELSPKSLDQLVSYGERCSVRIVAARLNQIGVQAQPFDAWDVGILTDSNFGDASLLSSSDSIIRQFFS